MCSVVGCDSWRRRPPRFKLPEDPERRLEWVLFIAKVNKQRFKESSWTDITVCSEHFAGDCFGNVSGAVQLKPGAVPSLCVSSGPDKPAGSPGCGEPADYTEAVSQRDPLKACDGSNSCSEESRPTSMVSQNGLVPSGASNSADPSVRSQMQPKNVNASLMKEKAALLKTKGNFPVNEKRLLRLFSRRCPSCGGKLKMHKVTRGVVVILNQLCLQCDWKSQVRGGVPAAEDGHLREGAKVSLEAAPGDESSSSISEVPEVVAVIDEENDSMDESSDPVDTSSDEDWRPAKGVFPVKLFHVKPSEKSEVEHNYNDCYSALTPQYNQLCTECGTFFDRRRPHACEHKVRPYSCNICGSRCVNKHALNLHNRIHDENYEFRCKYCYATFKLKAAKITHEQIHLTQDTPYKCPDCPETFPTHKERRIHLEDHRGPKQLKCPVCGIEFRWPVAFQRHSVVHTGEKPYKCSVCQRGFKQTGHLKSHMRLHTGERPYKCQHCDKCFNHNVSLKSHVQRYHAPKQKKDAIHKSDTDGAQSNGNKRDAESELDSVEEEQDTDDGVLMGCMDRPKSTRKCTGRPIGRPKSSISGKADMKEQEEGQGSDTGTRKSRGKTQMRKHRTDEESKEEPSDSNTSFDCAKQERCKRTIKNKARPRTRPEDSDLDSDFKPAVMKMKKEEEKKKRSSNQNKGKRLGKRKGRPRKNLVKSRLEIKTAAEWIS
ncbi:uncharacterized protein PAE49_016203 isoform 2-T2 [Odontesthes bonariensis]|uniref:uncharacterized protein LOC142399049 n=1 Tax=Odontesthes bonariensis TaxID=219752 RepID=UPI003F587E4C